MAGRSGRRPRSYGRVASRPPRRRVLPLPTSGTVSMRLPGLERYLRDPQLPRPHAAAVLRGVFAAMFLGQMVVALLLGSIVRLVGDLHTRPSPLLGWVLVLLAALELPLGAVLASIAGRGDDRRRGLSATLLGAVILSTPAWFAALALATGQRGAPVLVLWGLLALYYAFGVAGAGRLAARAVRAPPTPRG